MNDNDPLLLRFRNFAPLSEADEARLRSLSDNHQQTKAARRDLIREGDKPRGVYLILAGWAGRYKMLEDGRRQLLQFLLPGDLCDVHNVILSEMDHSITTLTEVRYVEILHDRIEELERAGQHLRHALWWQSMTAIALQREWTINIGQRSASERLAHLFCELFFRLSAVGLTDHDGYEMKITQADLAEATGLTAVHVNRTLQSLREESLIMLQNKRLTIPDLAALQKRALFSATYLHFENRKAQIKRPFGDAPHGEQR